MTTRQQNYIPKTRNRLSSACSFSFPQSKFLTYAMTLKDQIHSKLREETEQHC